jgi:outer membrane immunogenic protein
LPCYDAIRFKRSEAEDLKMKKLVLALTAVAAFSASAVAADLSPRTYSKAPPPVMAPSWTGFYLFGGGGYGIFDSNSYRTNAAGVQQGLATTVGGDGYFGTVGAGYDWQFNSSWVAGVFADGQFGSIRGSMIDPVFGFNAGVPGGTTGPLKDKTNAAAGVRIGYLVAPNVLSYVNGGYSYASFGSSTQLNIATIAVTTTPSFSRSGWFLGGGVENNLDIFGISAPGWFMKTEYRVAEYSRVSLPETFVPGIGVGLVGASITERPIVQTVSTSLVYRFNWGGPVVAKY